MGNFILLSNGQILAFINSRGQTSRLYYPAQLLENHLNKSYPLKMGVFTGQNLSWLDGSDWEIEVGYQEKSALGLIQARNSTLGLRIEMIDGLLPEKNILLKKITVFNNRNYPKNLKLFFNQNFYIFGLSSGTKAFLEPSLPAIIHRKNRLVFLVSGVRGKKFFDDYTVGLAHFRGYEGTWRDAEDGILAKNTFQKGRVDSTFGFDLKIKPRSYKILYFWIGVGRSLKEVQDYHNFILKKTPYKLLTQAAKFWRIG